MALFNEYLQPLTTWLYTHPEWAIFFTFLISLTESLAIIGSIIPGSVTMTAIGILAGSGVMRIDLTLIAATLGAIAGDTASYALGYIFSDRLIYIWPFKRYPHWLAVGKDYFASHGGKSVLIGRFIGPLRSIIPVIAGMMHMSKWRFVVANVISAIGWAILYVVPGIIIGAASNELSAENATKLFLFIIIALVCLWLLGSVLRWALRAVNRILSNNLHHFWLWSKKHPQLSRFFTFITPIDEQNHYPTAALVIFFIFSLIMLSLFIIFTLYANWVVTINESAHLLLQSLRVPELDFIFLFLTQLISYTTLLITLFCTIAWFVYKKNYRGISYCLSLVSTAFISAKILSYLIYHPSPHGILTPLPGSSFPDTNLAVATALFGFLALHLNRTHSSLSSNLLKFTLLSILPLSSLASLYLGDYWLSDVLTALALGSVICLFHWLAYRNKVTLTLFSPVPALALLVIILITSTLTLCLQYKTLIYNHTPYQKQHVISEIEWWEQTLPILPSYRTNRIGQKASELNIQYVGSLATLRQALKKYGWEKYDDSFFTNMLKRMTAQTRENSLPLFTQLYHNQSPALVMTYFDDACQCHSVLHLWNANYYLTPLKKHVWIGSIYINQPLQHLLEQSSYLPKSVKNPIMNVQRALKGFKMREVSLPNHQHQLSNGLSNGSLLLIKESQ